MNRKMSVVRIRDLEETSLRIHFLKARDTPWASHTIIEHKMPLQEGILEIIFLMLIILELEKSRPREGKRFLAHLAK